MTPVWQSVLQQVLFMAGIFALAFAALEDSHSGPGIKVTTNILVEHAGATVGLSQP